jgi:hypothetical protein
MPLRYAILHHQLNVGDSHFDLLCETAPNSSLAAWRSPRWPIEQPTEVTRIKDHRRIYLDFEGEISEGRGYITRVAGGGCEVTVGEGSRWTIRLLDGAAPQTLAVRPLAGELWMLGPADMMG